MAKETKNTTAAEAAPPPAAAPKAAPAIDSPEFHNLTAAERTQIVADANYSGSKKFQCSIRDCPTITIAAEDEGQARSRYYELCGIRSTENAATVLAV